MQQAINWKGNLRRDYFYYIYLEIKTVLPLINYNCVLYIFLCIVGILLELMLLLRVGNKCSQLK